MYTSASSLQWVSESLHIPSSSLCPSLPLPLSHSLSLLTTVLPLPPLSLSFPPRHCVLPSLSHSLSLLVTVFFPPSLTLFPSSSLCPSLPLSLSFSPRHCVLPSLSHSLSLLTTVFFPPSLTLFPSSSLCPSLPLSLSFSPRHCVLPSLSHSLSLLTTVSLPLPPLSLALPPHHGPSLFADGVQLIKYDDVKSTVDAHLLLLRLCLRKQLPSIAAWRRGQVREERGAGQREEGEGVG